MTRKYFGTDGIRGKVGLPPITPEFVLRLGMAAGRVLASRAQPAGVHPTVLIGKDTRISGYMLESALESGFSAAGVDVLLVGPMPTPAVAYLTRALRLSAGIVISASHNPFDDNGIKFFNGDGEKLSDAIEEEIEAVIDEQAQCKSSDKLGKVRRLNDASGRYIEFCKNTFPSHLSLRGLKLVIDCANGAAYQVASPVFHELGAEVVVIGHEPDGFNINAGVGATHPEALAKRVVAEQADYGIALDGDGDRLIMVDGQGTVFDGDQLLFAIVKDRLRHVSMDSVLGVVGTLMTNLGFERAMEKLHIDFQRSKVGDRYVLEMLKETGWNIGGESEVVAEFTRYPQTLINIPVSHGKDWQKIPEVTQACALAQKTLGKSGRLLIRRSGTEPVVRVMVEANDSTLCETTAQSVAAALKAHCC